VFKNLLAMITFMQLLRLSGAPAGSGSGEGQSQGDPPPAAQGQGGGAAGGSGGQGQGQGQGRSGSADTTEDQVRRSFERLQRFSCFVKPIAFVTRHASVRRS
jgi:hypothetical protein